MSNSDLSDLVTHRFLVDIPLTVRGGGARDAPGVEIPSISCSFRQKICKITPTWELTPPLQENSYTGSPTAF